MQYDIKVKWCLQIRENADILTERKKWGERDVICISSLAMFSKIFFLKSKAILIYVLNINL